MPDRSDEDLMELVSARYDEDAFRQLFDRYWDRVVAYLGSRSGGRQVAEDLGQETFLNLVRYRHTYGTGRPFAPWLFRIARNLLTRSGRRRARRAERVSLPDPAAAPGAAEPVAPDGDPAASSAEREARQAVAAALDRLDADSREVVLLRIREGWTFPDIGRALGVGEDAARKRFQSALARLRAKLGRRGLA